VVQHNCSIEQGRIGLESWADAINDTLHFACTVNRPIAAGDCQSFETPSKQALFLKSINEINFLIIPE
jgi:hypothetical protein